MRISELAEKLVKEGAWISIERHGLTAPIGLAQFYVDRLVYCIPFPEDQHHVHEVLFDRYDTNGTGIMLWSDGKLVAYISKAEDWPEVDLDQWKEDWSKWKAELRKPGVKDRYLMFMTSVFEMS